MARLPRAHAAGYPHHVIQRGNNHQAIFADVADNICHLQGEPELKKATWTATKIYRMSRNPYTLQTSLRMPSAPLMPYHETKRMK